MMKITYRVIIAGLSEGSSLSQVKSNLAELFKTTVDKLPDFFGQPNYVVKKNLDVDTAKKYQLALQQQGCVCVIEAEQPIDLTLDEPPQAASLVNSIEIKQLAPATPEAVTEKEFKFCYACGFKLPRIAKFCRGCGSTQSKTSETQTSTQPASIAPTLATAIEVDTDAKNLGQLNNQTTVEKPSKIKRVTAFGFFIVLGAICLGVWLNDKSSQGLETDHTALTTEQTSDIPNKSTALKDLFGVDAQHEKIKTSTNEIISVWHQQAFKDGKDDVLVFFTKTRGIDPDPVTGESISCHNCPLSIGVITYKQIGGIWKVVSKQPKFTEHSNFNSWAGDIIDIDGAAKELKIGPKATALLIESGADQAGYAELNQTLFTFENNNWRNLGAIQTDASTSNACDKSTETPDLEAPGCWSYTGKITTQIGKNPNYYDLIILRTGTESSHYVNNIENIKKAENAKYIFNGKEYVLLEAVIQSTPAASAKQNDLALTSMVEKNDNKIPVSFQGVWTDERGCKNHKAGLAFDPGAEITANRIVRYEHDCALVNIVASSATTFSAEFSCSQDGEITNENISLILQPDGKLAGISSHLLPVCK